MRGEVEIHPWMVIMFWSRMSPGRSGCWNWIGQKAEGYGVFEMGKVQELAHRTSYRMERGKIPKGMLVCHTCDNPSCVNPNHLFLGTDLDNNRDMMQKGRGRQPIGENAANSKLTEDEVRKIREVYTSGETCWAKLGRMFGTSAENVSIIVQRKTWRHVV
jgi:hypothetical protein